MVSVVTDMVSVIVHSNSGDGRHGVSNDRNGVSNGYWQHHLMNDTVSVFTDIMVPVMVPSNGGDDGYGVSDCP